MVTASIICPLYDTRLGTQNYEGSANTNLYDVKAVKNGTLSGCLWLSRRAALTGVHYHCYGCRCLDECVNLHHALSMANPGKECGARI